MLRPGNVHGAHDWRQVLEPILAGYERAGVRRCFRTDAAFANRQVTQREAAPGPGLPFILSISGMHHAAASTLTRCSRCRWTLPRLHHEHNLPYLALPLTVLGKAHSQ